jgi:hypothetical protein
MVQPDTVSASVVAVLHGAGGNAGVTIHALVFIDMDQRRKGLLDHGVVLQMYVSTNVCLDAPDGSATFLAIIVPCPQSSFLAK